MKNIISALVIELCVIERLERVANTHLHLPTRS
jgi:hypothetical protein